MSKFGVPTESQLSKINKLAKRTLSSDEVFVWPGKLAGDMIIPDRYIQLTKDLLDVFAADAAKGVSLLIDHSWHADGFWGVGGRPKAAIPYGRTFDSRFEASNVEGETTALMADHYMVRGVEIDGIKTDDLITSIEAGTLFDTSIGFNYNKATCSICENSYNDYEKCKHIAGKTYEVEGEDGVTRNELCYVKAGPPGGLWENSLVFDGAYPTAGALSKGDIIENQTGVYEVITETKGIDPLKHLVATYSQKTGLITLAKKSEHKKQFVVGNIDKNRIFELAGSIGLSNDQVKDVAAKVLKGDEKSMNEKALKMLESLGIAYKEGETKIDELFGQVAEKWDAMVQEIQASATPLEAIEGLSNAEFLGIPVSEIKERFGKELSADAVLKLAKEGQEYKKTLIDDALAMGVRAQGNDFPSETWKSTFASMGIAQIKDITKTFELQAKDSIPAGRHTDPAAGQKQSQSQYPDSAFKLKK